MSNITKDDNIISANSKNEALDFIMSNCFKSGFGALSKTDIDLILFTAILKYSDDNKKSDFELCKYLQITQQRIRNLREKASVKYPTLNRSEAIDEFLQKCEFSKVEETHIDILDFPDFTRHFPASDNTPLQTSLGKAHRCLNDA